MCSEGERLWPHMSQGQLVDLDGVTRSGISPSGAKRGDKFIGIRAAKQVRGGCEKLALMDECLTAIGEALIPALLQEPALRLPIKSRSEGLFACYPGNGAEYRAHLDGGGSPHCKLTMILYPNPDWAASSGGALHLLDERGASFSERAWRSVQPAAGTIVLFRSDRVLHKVVPAFATRYALTAFWFTGTDEEVSRGLGGRTPGPRAALA